MARPLKNGLQYFPLDVDIFEDEKVIPVSSEYGAKGDCIVIRVLCAIYRNGYFAECSDAFKYKIAKQSGQQANLVSEVIAGLVKWGFFDKTVFNSFSVLTSKGIQKRWLEATRRRVKKNELDYWLINDDLYVSDGIKELLTSETPLNQTETTQSKVKESKEKEIKGEENNICQNLVNFDRNDDSLILSDSQDLISVCEEKNTPLSNEKSIFEECRKLYPGTKRGFKTEFFDFKNKHKTSWRQAVHLLKPAIEKEIEFKRKSKENGIFTPEWKNFKTWLSQCCWEQELPDIINLKRSKNGTSASQQYKIPDWI